MEELQPLIDAIQKDGHELTPDQIARIDGDLTKLAELLLDFHFGLKRRKGRKDNDRPADDIEK